MLLLPIKGIAAIAQKIKELLDNETSESAIKQQLLDLQMRLEINEIDLDQYDQKEAELLEQLEAKRAERERDNQS